MKMNENESMKRVWRIHVVVVFYTCKYISITRTCLWNIPRMFLAIFV